MTNLNIGKIIDKPFLYKRDAIHVAVAPIVAGQKLNPGQHIRVDETGMAMCSTPVFDPIGIVDPFLKETVKKDQTFWLFLYPGSITSLRHEWTHPFFANQDRSGAEKWLRDFAASLNFVSYDDLIEGTKEYLSGHYTPTRWSDSFSVPAEFWVYFEVVTGIHVPDSEREEYFSCSWLTSKTPPGRTDRPEAQHTSD